MNSATPASHSPNSSKVAPRKLKACSRPCPVSPPTRLPSAPPAVFGNADPSQCNVARPQLVTRVNANPAARSKVLMRERASGSACSLCTSQPAYANIKGNRYAGRPNRNRKNPASQAPTGPIQLLTCARPGSPVSMNDGSCGW